MENLSYAFNDEKQDVSLTQSMVPSDITTPPASNPAPDSSTPPDSTAAPNSNAPRDSNAPPEYTSYDPPPPYTNPSLYPSTLGIPYSPNYPHGMPGIGCPPEGQHCYPPPGFVYPGPQAANTQTPYRQPQTQHHHHQQQRVIVVNNQNDEGLIVTSPPPVSMTGPIILACFVTWFCAYICGIVALRLACAGRRLAAAGENVRAIRMGRASVGCSITGIVTGIIIIVVVVCVYKLSPPSTPSSSSYYKQNSHRCYSSYLGYYYTC